MSLPSYPAASQYSISADGLQEALKLRATSKLPGQNVIWTTDFKVELPIRMGKSGVTAAIPTTIIQQFQLITNKYKGDPALSVKRNGSWFTYTYGQYFDLCVKFGKSLLAYKFQQFTTLNLIGFNAPQWAIAFFGSIFARCIPIGIYTTNNVQTCEYIVNNSNSQVVIAENREYAKKYFGLLETGVIKLIVIYNDPNYKEQKYGNKIIQFSQFIKEGQNIDDSLIRKRMFSARPGHCITLVYTSGTTGMPKGVMLSHDNYTWTKKAIDQTRIENNIDIMRHRIISYLPLSHVAAQFSDLAGCMMDGGHLFFAEPTALQGTLIQTLKQVRPTLFFSVPRVWQKIYDKMMQIAKSNGWLKTKIATWAKQLGPQGTLHQMRKQKTSLQYKLAKILVYNNVKKALGLDQCLLFIFGAAPLDPNIRKYFLSLNIYLINGYGMSESSGPQNLTSKKSLDINGPISNFRQVGVPMVGTQMIIIKQNPNDEDGQICYRGRNTFMGYYKNPEDTAKTIDQNGFLHSGDNGKITKNGVLFITGRAKQLIITAGGQNIPPILIQTQIKEALPCVANVMVIGDMRKYLACLITLKEDPPGSGKLQHLAKSYLADRGCAGQNIKDVLSNEKLRKIIQQGVKKANQKAISRAQHVQDFIILSEDFTVENGLLTPTLKLKRKQVLKKYDVQIETMYNKPSL